MAGLGPEQLRAIAFCADIAHAHEVQRRLLQHHLRAEVLTGQTASALSSDARGRLDAGEVQVLCVVDIYNEGVDVSNVNTLFFFRPTESATVFLQQLGRGLRRAPCKPELVVFDLTGRQHHSFRFDRKLRGVLRHTPKELQEFAVTGFGRLPAGCFVAQYMLAPEGCGRPELWELEGETAVACQPGVVIDWAPVVARLGVGRA